MKFKNQVEEAFEHNPKMLGHKYSAFDMFTNHAIHSRSIKNRMHALSSATTNRDALRAQAGAEHIKHLDEQNPYELEHTSPHAAAMRSYTSGLSAQINRALFDKSFEVKESLRGRADDLHDLIKTHAKPLDRTAHVYSGIGFDPTEHFESSGSIHMPAFTSTSLNYTTSSGFGEKKPGPASSETRQLNKPLVVDAYGEENHVKSQINGRSINDHHIIHFELPVGYNKGIHVRPKGAEYPEEHEYILDRDQKWKLKKHEIVRSNVTLRGSHTVGVPQYDSSTGKHTREVARRTGRNLTRHHIWTVVPHDEPVNEGLVHIPQLFGHSSTQLYGTYNQTRIDKVKNIHDKMRAIVTAHDSAASEHMHANYSTDHLNPEEKHVIREYTGSTSGPTNRHLLKPVAELVQAHAKAAYDIAKRYPHHSDEVKDAMLRKSSPLHIHGNNIKKLDDIFKHKAHTLKEDLHVYSGIGFDPSEHFESGHGVFHSPAFMSTSVGVSAPKSFGQAFASQNGYHDQWDDSYTSNKDNAEIVKQGSRSEQDKHIIHFHLPKGYNGGLHISPESKFPEEREFLLNRNQKWKLINHEVHTVRDHSRYRTFVPARKSVWDSSVEYPARRNYETYQTKQRNHIWTVVPHDEPVNEARVHSPDYFSGVNYHTTDWNTFQQGFSKKSNPLRDHGGDVLGFENDIADDQASHIKVEPAEHGMGVIHTYTSDSRKINNGLLYGKHSNLHDELDGWLKSHTKPLHEDMHVYSGAGFDPTKHFEEGNGVIHLPAYTSTSLSPSIAGSFGAKALPSKGLNHRAYDRHILHFHLPKGSSHGTYVDHVSTHDGEKEYILHRGQKWKLTNHETVRSRDITKYTNWGSGTGRPINKTDYTTHIWSLEPHND